MVLPVAPLGAAPLGTSASALSRTLRTTSRGHLLAVAVPRGRDLALLCLASPHLRPVAAAATVHSLFHVLGSRRPSPRLVPRRAVVDALLLRSHRRRIDRQRVASARGRRSRGQGRGCSCCTRCSRPW